MKLSGTVALYTQLKELENAVAVTKRQIALAEELLQEAPAKKVVRRKRTAKPGQPDSPENYGFSKKTKALPYGAIIERPNGADVAI